MNYNKFSSYLFSESELSEMNDAYQVDITWPDYLLIGLDGGGNGLFINKNGRIGIYRIQMGCPIEPEYFCDSLEDIDDAIKNDFETEILIEKYDIEIYLNAISDIAVIRRIQGALGIDIEKISTLKNKIGQTYRILINGQKVVIEKFLSRIDGIRNVRYCLVLNESAQQVDSAEASTIAVPPSEPSGSPR